MSWKVANLCAERKFGSAVRKQIVMFLADKASDDGTGIFCSKGTIARHTELGGSTVKRTISAFLNEGILVETGQQRRCRNGYTVVYRISLSAVEALESLREPDDELDLGTRVTGHPVPTGPGTGVLLDEVPGPQRPTNHPKTIQKPNQSARAREESEFSAFWDDWPVETRPDKRAYAQHLFERLTKEDRARAIAQAATYRTRWAVRSKPALMIPYLKARLFLECDAPCTRDGNAAQPDREHKQQQAVRQAVPQLFVAVDQGAQIRQWQDWLAGNELPPLESLGVEDRRNGKPGYRLPSYWPPEAGSLKALEWTAYFRRRLKRGRYEALHEPADQGAS